MLLKGWKKFEFMYLRPWHDKKKKTEKIKEFANEKSEERASDNHALW